MAKEHKFNTVPIKGKEYVTVNERVKYFRSEYPNYGIETELLQLNEDWCCVKAFIKDDKGRILSTGIASEEKASSYINKTSYVENCETSAIGRALGTLGIGIDVSICSADELANAVERQEIMAKTISENDLDALHDLIIETNSDVAKIKKVYKVKMLEDLTYGDFLDLMKKLTKKKEGK